MNQTAGRREVKRLTGDHWVPALVTDDGAVISGSRPIMEWAVEHPAPDRAMTDATA
jgi:glutathione S-transferase